MKLTSKSTQALLCLSMIPFVLGSAEFLTVLEYFKARKIGTVNVFVCEDYDKTVLRRPEFMGITRNLKFSKAIRRETLDSIFGTPPQVVGAAVPLDCTGSWEVLEWVGIDNMAHLAGQISWYRSFNSSFAYGIMTENPINETLALLYSLAIAFDSDVVVLTGQKLYDVYRTAEGEQLTSVEIGEWNATGLVLNERPKRWDLRGVTLKACTVLKEFPKEHFLKEGFYDHNNVPYMDALSRFPCRQHKSIEQLMNFKTNFSLVPDWGYWDQKRGRFDEGSMYGTLQDGEYEFGLTLSWMYSQRLESAFFSPVTHFYRSSVVFRHPPAGASVTAFALPFTWGTWLTIFSFFAVGSVLLHIIITSLENSKHEARFSDSLFYIAGVICLNSSYVNPVKIPTRVVALAFQIMALMVYSYYGATILGFLLSPSPRTITNVDKLLDSNLLLWVENVSFHKAHFMAGVSSKATKFYNKAIKGLTPDQDRYVNLIVGLKMVQKGGTGLYGISPNLYENVKKLYSNSEICSLHFIDLMAISTAVPIQKRSPYRDMYCKAVSWMIESGLNNYEEKHWHDQKPQCVGTEENVAVRLEATLIAQVLYASGVLLAIIIFTIEKALTHNRADLVVNKNNRAQEVQRSRET